jgi:assimilatory nitrate reductase catalytic subunit
VGCGIIATPDGKGGASIEGDPNHPANFGILCSKGTTLGDTLGLETRVLHPMMRNAEGVLARVGWDTALDAVASGFRKARDEYGPGAIAFYLSGQLLTEDYYVANKLMKGFFGSGNADTNSRLCMASSVAGHQRAFGADVVPGCYEDLDEAGLIVLVGSNTAWCHPILFQRMLRNRRERGAKIVAIDTRRTATTAEADLVLQISPGMDSVLFSGLFTHLFDTGACDADFVSRHTSGLNAALSRARHIAPSIPEIATRTGLSAVDIATFFDWFAKTPRTVTCYSQGVNQSAQGTDKVNAIINCHLLTGRIGKPGMGPFSLTGQPNAMGGREVGGLATQLAAHMGFSALERDRVQRFWDAPAVAERPGLKAVQMFEAVEAGRIKALWVMGTNPVASLPRGGALAAALRKLDLFAVSDNVLSNDTINAGAHVVLPAAAWGEKDGTVTNSERRISRQRAFLALRGEAKPDWWILSQVAPRLGWKKAFSYIAASEIFSEHARLSAFENEGGRAFDLSGLDISPEAYDSLEPFQWPVSSRRESKRLFDDGRFLTPDGKARFIAVDPPSLATAVSDTFPLRLNTGRLRDQWHTMTRTGLSSRLAEHSPEPHVLVSPDDAARFGLTDGGFARVTSAHGALVAKVCVTSDVAQGSVFAPIHWNREVSWQTCAADLVDPSCDPFSGQPEAKATPCSVAPLAFTSTGFMVARKPFPGATGWYSARQAVSGGFVTRFAANADLADIEAHTKACLADNATISEYRDEGTGVYRAVALHGGRIDYAVFACPSGNGLPAVDAAVEALSLNAVGPVDVLRLLSGSDTSRVADRTICICLNVRKSVLLAAMESGCVSVQALGQRTGAGTNCGSCRPELAALLAASPPSSTRVGC